VSSTLHIVVEQIASSTAKASARSHSVLIDRPEAKGGTDRGPLGGELMLIGFAGCFMSNLLAAIRARNAAISHIRIEADGTMEGTPERFTAFTLNISANHSDPALVRKVISIADRACAVTNTLRLAASVAIVFEGAPVDAAVENAV
jgi:putative redox protein